MQGFHCADLHKTHNCLINFFQHLLPSVFYKSDKEDRKYEKYFINATRQSTVFKVSIFTKLTLFNGIKWRSSITNFTQISQQAWKVLVEMQLIP